MHFRCLLPLRNVIFGLRGKSTATRAFVRKDIMSQDVNANKNKVYKVVLTGGRSVSMHMFYAKKGSFDGLFTFLVLELFHVK